MDKAQQLFITVLYTKKRCAYLDTSFFIIEIYLLSFLAQVLHEYACISALTNLLDSLLTNLANTLTGKTHLCPNLFQTLLLATDAETLGDNLYLTILQCVLKNGTKVV